METFIHLKKQDNINKQKNHTHLPRPLGFIEELYQHLAVEFAHIK